MSGKGGFRWTPRHQSIAEVAAACGVSMRQIGMALGVSGHTVAYRLNPGTAELLRNRARAHYASNPERSKKGARRWRQENPERDNANHRSYRQANRERLIYYEMIRRCNNPSVRGYHRYGGRGIKVCDRWLSSIDAFLEDMGPRPSPRLSIERVDNNRGYEPGNCRWATSKEQGRNRENNRIVSYSGQEMSLAEAAERAGLNYALVCRHLQVGWSVDEALEVVPRQRRKRLGETG